MLCCGRTDVGKKRKVNQDSFFCEYYDNGMMLCVVCDGMGGAAGGGIASGFACQTFVDCVAEFAEKYSPPCPLTRTDERIIRKVLAEAVDCANKKVFDTASEDLSLTGMGTTIVATLVVNRTLFTVNVGDSRMYLIKDGAATQITKDHSLVEWRKDGSVAVFVVLLAFLINFQETVKFDNLTVCNELICVVATINSHCCSFDLSVCHLRRDCTLPYKIVKLLKVAVAFNCLILHICRTDCLVSFLCSFCFCSEAAWLRVFFAH